MARKRYKPEEIVSLLWQAEMLHGQSLSMADAIRRLGIGWGRGRRYDAWQIAEAAG